MADYGNGGALVNTSQNYVNAYTGEAENFDANHSLANQMKEFVETAALRNFHAQKYFAQFGKKIRLPENHGTTMELRKPDKFADVGRLIEGVIPKGLKFGYSSKHAVVYEYGDYVALSRRLERHAIDDVSADRIVELSAAAANTLDKLVRNELLTGTNVFYAPDADGVAAQDRSQLTNEHIITSQLIARAATELAANGAPRIGKDRGICVTHPYVIYDLRTNDKMWIDAHIYANPEDIYNGEEGKMHGIRFVQSDNAMVYVGEDGGVDGAAVFVSLVFGGEAYAVIEPEGGDLEMIIKTAREAGGPLNQFSTAGVWFETGAKILYDEFLIRIESGCSIGDSVQDVDTESYLYKEAVGNE